VIFSFKKTKLLFLCLSFLVLITGCIWTTNAVEWHNWRLPYYTIASEMDAASSSPSGMFWDDLSAAPVFDSTLWPSAKSVSNNHWELEPALSFGTQAPYNNDSLYSQLEMRSDIRYRNLLVRNTLCADRRYDNDSLYPAHPGRFARGRIEEAYAQMDWSYGFVRFGRLVRNWGPFVERSLTLSSNPYSYDGLEWGVHSNLFEFRQLFAAFATNSHFSDSNDNRPGRFFTAHSLNVMLGKWTTLGVFESFVFRRNNGFPDFQYVNPFSVYSVLNLNQEGDGNSMLGFQWKVHPGMENLSFKGQILLDDIQVDRKTSADKSEPAHWGIDAGVFWRDCLPIAQRHLFKIGYWRTSEWVYTVDDNNTADGQGYTYLEKGLGWPTNDGDNLYAGFSIIGRNFWAATATVAYGRQGQNSVTSRWYDSDSGNIAGVPFDYRLGSFPSGIVQKTISLSFEAMGYYRNYMDVRIGIVNQLIRNKNHIVSAGFVYSPMVTAETGFHFSAFNIALPK
jgi:hypothetical protein